MATGYNADAKITIGTSVDVGGINSGLDKIERSFKKLSKLTLGVLSIKAFAKFGSAALEAASDLTEVQNIVDVTFKSVDELGNVIEDNSWKIENFAKTAIDNFGMSELAAKQTAGSFAAMGNAMGLTRDEATSMAVELTALTGDFASFYNISQDYARVALSAVYTGETETLKRYGIVLTEANLQEYAQSQGIAESVKNMSAREKLILRYNYIQSVTNDIDGDFIRTQDTWANQTRVLKKRWEQFLITLGNGLITVLLPMVKALNQLLSATITYANALGALISKLFGIDWQKVSDGQGSAAGTASDAADAEEDLADATSDAAKAADKALGAYDKLNVIQKDTSKSSGAGDDGLGLDFTDIDSQSGLLDAAVKKMKLSFDSLYEAGRYVGTNLTKALNSIDWDSVYQGARNFGTGLADFLNGLISPELFSAVGKTIANSLNTAIYTALSFGQEFDFTNLGLSIATGVNSFFSNFDFASLAQTINTWVSGLRETIKTVITNIDWSEVFNGMKEFFTNLSPDTLATIIGFIALKKTLRLLTSSTIKEALMKGIIEGVTGTKIQGSIFETLARKIGLMLGTKLKGGAAKKAVAEGMSDVVNGGVLSGTVEADTAVGEALNPIVDKSIPSFFAKFKTAWTISSENLKAGQTLGEAIKTGFGGIFGDVAVLVAGVASIIAGAVTAVVSFVSMWKKGWSIIKTILEALGIALVAIGAILLGAPAAIAAIVAGIVFALSQIVLLVKEHWDKISEVLGNIGNWIYDNVITPVADFFVGLGTKIGKVFSSAWETIKGVWSTVSEWFDTYIITPVVTIFEGATTRIGQFFEGCWIIIKAIWIIVSTWFDENIIQPLITIFTTFKDTIVTIFTTAWDAIKLVWEIVSTWFDEHIIQPVITVFNLWKDKVTDIFTTTWDTIKNIWEVVSTWFDEHIIQPVSELFTTAKEAIVLAFETAWSIIKNIWDKVTDFFEPIGNTIINIFDTVTSTVANVFANLWDGITSGARGIVNSIIGFFERMVNGVISAINGILKGFNKIVGVAAKITGDKWGGVDLIPKINIPRLAQGAVIPPNKEFMAVLGDQKQGTNIETPLSTMIEAFTAALDARGGSTNNQPIILQLPNGKVIAELVWSEEEKRYKQTGSYRPKYS